METSMPHAYIPREQVHAWSDDMSDNFDKHQLAITRLVREQRRLTRFFEENKESMVGATGGVGVYLLGVVCRMFDLAGGRLKSATWAHVRAAEKRVQSVVGDLLPLDDGFSDRVRQVEWRAQPHILDEALMALFHRDPEDQDEDEEELSNEENLKVFFLLWVSVEVLDGNWRPAKTFQGLTEYTYVHFEPTKRDEPAVEAEEVAVDG